MSLKAGDDLVWDLVDELGHSSDESPPQGYECRDPKWANLAKQREMFGWEQGWKQIHLLMDDMS